MLKLRVLHEGVEIQNVDLKQIGKPVFTIGRAEECDIRINNHAVGREHVVVSMRDHVLYLKKKSKFGLMSVNGNPTSEAEVKSGDVISIADYKVEFLEEATQVKEFVEPKEVVSEKNSFVEMPLEDIKVASVTENNSIENNIEANNEIKLEPTGDVFGLQDLAEKEKIQTADTQGGSKDSNESIVMVMPTGSQSSDQSSKVFSSEGKTAVLQTNAFEPKLIFRSGDANVTEYIIEKSEVSIGRGSDCDIVLNDKLSSRKNSLIRKVGLGFVLQDLGSGNGTLVNGNKIQNHELQSGDKIQIGDIHFQFQAIHKDYQDKQHEFLNIQNDKSEVRTAPTPMPISMPTTSPIPDFSTGNFNQNTFGATDFAKKEEPPKTLVDKFKKLSLIGKIAVVGTLLLLWFYMDDAGTKSAKPKETKVKSDNPEFDKLPAEKKQFVVNTYQLAYDLFKNGEFEKSLFEIKKVLEIIPSGYKDAKDLKDVAEQAIDKERLKGEEKKRKEDQERIKKEVVELETQANDLFKAGKEDDLRAVFTKIFELDPENELAIRLKQQIDEKHEKEKRDNAEKAELEITRQKLVDLINQGKALLKKQKFFEVMDLMPTAPSLGCTDAKLLAQAKSLISAAVKGLANKVKPFLTKGQAALAEKNYPEARDSFLKALRIDPFNRVAQNGIAKVREELEKRSRIIYSEAVIRESVSDYIGAQEKYKECLTQSMPDDIYFGRCTRKLKRFEIRADESAAPGAGSATASATASESGPEASDNENRSTASAASGDPAMPTFKEEEKSE